MEKREIIIQELESISPVVANLERTNVFAVPANYFNDLPAVILAKVQSEGVAFGSKSDPFSVPAGYFDGLAANILNKIRSTEQSVEEELNEIAPLLNTVSRKPVYAVPEGYFESLELTIPLKLAKPSAKVFSFGKVVQYAVAASTIAIMAIGVYFYSGNSKSIDTPISFTEAKNMNVAAELDNLTETEIVSYLESAPSVGYALNVVPEEVNFEEYLDQASDEEINEYLKETAEPVGTGS